MEIALPVNSITLPPNNWKQMDKVQRAFALQIVMAMVTVGDEEPGNFPLASPPTLLEDYNMLALPGTGTHNDQDHMALAKWQLRSALKHMLVAQHHDVHWGEWSICWEQALLLDPLRERNCYASESPECSTIAIHEGSGSGARTGIITFTPRSGWLGLSIC